MCALIRKHVACALIMAEGEEEIVPAPGTSFVDTTSGSECEDDEPTSILDVLKAPKAAVRNRKRKVLTNCGCGKKTPVFFVIYQFRAQESYPATTIKRNSR